MQHLRNSHIQFDWITFISDLPLEYSQFRKDLENLLNVEFKESYKPNNSGRIGSKPKEKHQHIFWETFAYRYIYGISIKGPTADVVVENFLFKEKGRRIPREVRFGRIDVKIHYSSALPANQNIYKKTIPREVETFKRDQREHEATKKRKRTVFGGDGNGAYYVSLGERTNSMFTRFCFNPENSYLELEIKNNHTRVLNKCLDDLDFDRFENYILKLFRKVRKSLVDHRLVTKLDPIFSKIDKSFGFSSYALKEKDRDEENNSPSKESLNKEKELIWDSFKNEGTVFTLQTVLFRDTLNLGNVFIITLGILHLYAEQVLKTLDYCEYEKTLQFWNKGLNPVTKRRYTQKEDGFKTFSFTSRDISLFLDKPETTSLNDDIVRTMDFLGRLFLQSAQSFRNGKEEIRNYYAVPSWTIHRERGKMLTVEATMSHAFFLNLFADYTECKTIHFKKFSSFCKEFSPNKRSIKNVYHLVAETLHQLNENDDYFVLADFKSYPKSAQRVQRFVKSFMDVISYFAKEELLEGFQLSSSFKIFKIHID